MSKQIDPLNSKDCDNPVGIPFEMPQNKSVSGMTTGFQHTQGQSQGGLKMATCKDPCKVITGEVRLNYLYCDEARSFNGGEAKYSASIIISKSDTVTLEKIQRAKEEAYRIGESRLKGNSHSVPPLSAIKDPLRDGDAERPHDDAYHNAYFINANSFRKPDVVDANRNPIQDRSEMYSGVYGRASISFYAFNKNGNRGIACRLNALQKLRDGEPLGTRSSAASDFASEDNDTFLR